MKTANVAEFEKHRSAYLELVEAGESVEICRRNIPVARPTGSLAVARTARSRAAARAPSPTWRT